MFLAQAAVAQLPVADRVANPIQITADLTDASRHLFHAEIDLPVETRARSLHDAALAPRLTLSERSGWEYRRSRFCGSR